jgi:hypothetical protein
LLVVVLAAVEIVKRAAVVARVDIRNKLLLQPHHQQIIP